MKVMIDARNIMDRLNGLGCYAYHLVTHIAKLDKENEYILLKRDGRTKPIVIQDNFREISVKPDLASFSNCVFSEPKIIAEEVDVFHSLFYFYPKGLRAKRRVVTLHDLFWIDCPQVTIPNPIKAFFLKQFTKKYLKPAMEASDNVIAISELTKERTIHHYPNVKDRVVVIPHGLEEREDRTYEKELLPAKLQDNRYFISVGNSRPYRTFPDSWKRLQKRKRRSMKRSIW